MDAREQKKHVIVSGLFWKLAERISAQAVSLIVSIVLARILSPDNYGAVALVLVFIDLANVLVVNGISTALIQKKDADELDFSTMFWVNIVVATVIYMIIFLSAPAIAGFYNNEILVAVTRVLGIKILLAGPNSVQQAYVSRHMIFKKFFFATLVGTVISGIVGIVMAIWEFGVWALVAQYLTNSAIDMLVLFLTIDWRPKLMFSWRRAGRMVGYGWKITVGAIADELYLQARALIIGKRYSAADLAYYNKGDQFPKLIITNINSSISSVLFPAMSNENDKKENVKKLCSSFIKNSSYIISPMMIGMLAVAPALIEVLLGKEWAMSVPFLQIACINYMLTPINSANLQLIKAMGRSDIFLRIEVIKKAVGILILILAMPFGVYVLAFSTIIVQVVCNFINSIPTKRLVGYSYLDQLRDILPSVGLAAVMGGGVYLISFLPLPSVATLFAQGAAGVLIYTGLSKALHVKSYDNAKEVFGKYVKKLKRSAK